MSSLGVHFALKKAEIAKLRALPTDSARQYHVSNVIEEVYLDKHREWTASTDKAWDGIHRALTDGKLLYENGEFPLNHAILGGEHLYGPEDYIISLKTPTQVKAIATALSSITEASLRERYAQIDPDDYEFTVDEEDFEYVWENFQDVRQLYERAAQAGRYVIFTTDP